MSATIEISNKRANFEYAILDVLTAGISLTGTEIKSIRAGKANLSDGFCLFIEHELFLRNVHVSEYEKGGHYNHDAKRDRKLLLQKRELRKWEGKLKEKGLTIVPLKLFINDKGLAKLDIGLAKGKKHFDKREDLKSKDAIREIDRAFKSLD